MSSWNRNLSVGPQPEVQPANSEFGSGAAEHQPSRHCERRREEVLVETAKAGDGVSFGLLYEQNAARIYRTAIRIMKNREDAEDVVQEAFLNAFVHLAHFDGRARFSTWLTRITVNAALMKLRARRSRPELATCENIDDETFLEFKLTEPLPDPEEHCAQQEREQALRRAIMELQPPLREAIQIQRLEERSIAEAASRLGASVPATKTRLLRAKLALGRSPQLITLHHFGRPRTGLQAS